MDFKTTLLPFALATLLLPAAVSADSAYAQRMSEKDGLTADQRYVQAQEAMDAGDYERALEIMDSLSEEKDNPNIDAALYWKAYAEARLQRSQSAKGTVKVLLRKYPHSAWADDAQALELELQTTKKGGPDKLPPEDELKLYALDALMSANSERGIALLENFLQGDHSTALKQRALFVVAQHDAPRARQILMRTIKDGEPALRTKAIEYAGYNLDGNTEMTRLLEDAYNKNADPATRRAVIQAFMVAGASAPLAHVAERDTDSESWNLAVNQLGAMGAVDELKKLYASAPDDAHRKRILQAFGIAGATEPLLAAARDSSHPVVQTDAIQAIGMTGGGADELLKIYRANPDPKVRRAVMTAFVMQDDSKGLVTIFHEEKDPKLKREALQRLSSLDSPEAMQVLEEILEH